MRKQNRDRRGRYQSEAAALKAEQQRAKYAALTLLGLVIAVSIHALTI